MVRLAVVVRGGARPRAGGCSASSARRRSRAGVVTSMVPASSKRPSRRRVARGPVLPIRDVRSTFLYADALANRLPRAYAWLLLDAMQGDQTLFARADWPDRAWAIVDPLIEQWARTVPRDFPNCPAGSWGPEEAAELLERDGRRWRVLSRDAARCTPATGLRGILETSIGPPDQRLTASGTRSATPRPRRRGQGSRRRWSSRARRAGSAPTA